MSEDDGAERAATTDGDADATGGGADGRPAVVLVTGCSSGVGEATARLFREEGWTVYATARDEGDLAELAAAGCETATLDVTDPEEPARVVERVVDETGRLDVLVNNAGYGQRGALEDVPTRKVRRQFDVNVLGPHRLLRAALPHMRAAEDGTVVNVSSVAGRVSTPGMGVYAGSKFALEGMSDALRSEVEPHGLDVVLVEPGPVETDFEARATDELADLDRTGAYDEVYRFFEDRDAFGGLGASQPADVARVIHQAASCADPAPRYPVGRLAEVLLWARYLPDGLRDAAYGLVRRLV